VILRPMAEHHRKALKLKRDQPVLVCLGNPPYDLTEAVDDTNRARTGGWVRWGKDEKGEEAILRSFVDPALEAGHGIHVHNLYNLYVYFWRWALWKVFEWQEDGRDDSGRPLPLEREPNRAGIVSFISASSYLDGDAFCGMREHLRRLCDEIWILDLGGEGRGTRRSENVFAIQTPVAIAVVVRYGKAHRNRPGKVRYVPIVDGTRAEKLRALGCIRGLGSLEWEDCPDGWQAPFRPAGVGTYFRWPLLTDLFPWQQGGVKAGRTWVIAPDQDTLCRRWRALCNAEGGARASLFKDSPTGRKATDRPERLPPQTGRLKPIADLPRNAPHPQAMPYAYRSFDRQWALADARVLDRPGPGLWVAHGDKQVYLASLLTKPLGRGPAVTCCAAIPDLDHFSGRGAKDVVPLYRDGASVDPNVLPGLLDMLERTYKRKVWPGDVLAYVYGILAQPAFTSKYADQLGTKELRVPLTKLPALFGKVCRIGARLLWLHTYGHRFVPKGRPGAHVPRGKARCVKTVSDDVAGYPDKYNHDSPNRTLHVGDGRFAPVSPEVYAYEVSGLKVVQSWLNYRMKRPRGKKPSSVLDGIRPQRWTSELTTQLLELLWVLEATLAQCPAQAELLDSVVKGGCFKADELPPVPPEARIPPARPSINGLFDEPDPEEG
jgi:hypothetical protein